MIARKIETAPWKVNPRGLHFLSMLTQITNFHHSKLPPIGAIGRVRRLHSFGGREKFQVVAYPLNDNVSPYSIGIHTCFIRSMWNVKTPMRRISGVWFKQDGEGD